MTFKWEDKELILEIVLGVSKGWHGRKPSNQGRVLKYSNGWFDFMNEFVESEVWLFA